MNDNFNSSTRHPPRQLSIALVVLEGFDFASLSSTLEAISKAKRRLGAGVARCTTLGTNSSAMSSLGISVTPNIRLGETQLSEYDVIVLIGGSETTLKTHLALTQQLKSAAKAGRLLGGIWNGAYHLAAAGLTDGYECLITGDGRFSIESPTPKHRRYATWQFDERRMTCRDAYSATRMMEAMFDHFFGATATTNVAKRKTKSQQASGTDFFPQAC